MVEDEASIYFPAAAARRMRWRDDVTQRLSEVMERLGAVKGR